MDELNKVSSQWLESTNAELSENGVPASDRFEAAEKRWRHENAADLEARVDLDFGTLHDHLDQQIEKIADYFSTQSQKDRGYVEPPFVGIFFYRGSFWEASVPLVFGRARIDALENLYMPAQLKRGLGADAEVLNAFRSFYADCVDYAYAIGEVERKCPTDFSRELFRSGDKHLRASGSLLAQAKASSKAIEDARMSVEIFLKAHLSATENLTDVDLRRQVGHTLELAIDRCIANGIHELVSVRDSALQLPDVGARYEAPERTFGELWDSYRLALRIGATVLRNLTGRDCRKSFGVHP